MAIFLKPGPIEHLDHAWQPQEERWLQSFEASIYGIAVISALVLHGTETSGFRVTRKIDDGLSVRIGRINGNLAVGYKGSSSSWLFSENEIDAYYSTKPSIAHKLKGILRHSRGLNIANNWYIQAGYLGHDDNNLSPYIKPNIIEYEVNEECKLAIVPVSLNRINPNTGKTEYTTLNCESLNDSSGDVYLYDNTVYGRIEDIHSNYKLSDDMSKYLGEAGYFARLFFERFDGPNVVKNHHQIMSYLNSINRGSWRPNVYGFQTFLTETAQRHAHTLKTVKGRNRVNKAAADHVQYIQDNNEAYSNMFSMIDAVRQASVLLAKTSNGEGYTVSSIDDNFENLCFKIVDPDYTLANYLKWNSK